MVESASPLHPTKPPTLRVHKAKPPSTKGPSSLQRLPSRDARCVRLSDAWVIKRPCPATGCGPRVAILYLGDAGIFACRRSYRLVYASELETADSRATRRVDRIRERLGWEPDILNGSGKKPKGMNWHTIERLSAEHDAFVCLSLAWMANRLKLLSTNLNGLVPDGDS